MEEIKTMLKILLIISLNFSLANNINQIKMKDITHRISISKVSFMEKL